MNDIIALGTAALLMLSALCTAVLWSACAMAKRADEGDQDE